MKPLLKSTKKRCIQLFALGLLALILGYPGAGQAQQDTREKVIILTDIGQDPDDQQSLIRALLYANDINIQGILPTYIPGGRPVQPGLIHATLAAYKKDLPHLRLHDSRYPPAELLAGRIRAGLNTNSKVGAGYNSAAAKHIIYMVDRSTDPVWILVWGGSRELAQALYEVKTTRSAQQYKAFQDKLRVYTIGWSQYSDEPGNYMAANAKDMFWIASVSHDGFKTASFRGMYMFGDNSMQKESWIRANIKNRGHLGALYPLNTTESGMKEGDSPSLLHILPIGLSDPHLPKGGGWGGRYTKESRYYGISKNIYTAEHQLDILGGVARRQHSIARWRSAYQADFAARARWTVSNYANANHPPNARINGGNVRTVSPGQTVALDARPSNDPDGNALTYRWWIYEEASSFSGYVNLRNPSSPLASLVVPKVSKSETINVILEVKDSGSPALTRYQRVTLVVKP